jgi:hypothetical protein
VDLMRIYYSCKKRLIQPAFGHCPRIEAGY